MGYIYYCIYNIFKFSEHVLFWLQLRCIQIEWLCCGIYFVMALLYWHTGRILPKDNCRALWHGQVMLYSLCTWRHLHFILLLPNAVCTFSYVVWLSVHSRAF